MEASPISLRMDEIESATKLVRSVFQATPQYAWPRLGKRVGCTVWVKHEDQTPVGAFKVRGGIVYLNRLLQSQPRVPGVVTATRGNHGQSISFSAARAGIPATIFVPKGNSPDQNAAMAGFGADVQVFGKDFDEAKHEAFRVAAERGLHFVPSFHRDLVVGVSTYALELMSAVAHLDAIYVGIGMASGICGLIAVRDLLGLETEIIGVSAARAPATSLSFSAGKVVSTSSALTFADGIATREPDAQAVATICRGAARVLQVEEDEIAEAMRIYYDDTHHVAEGAGAAPLAALLQERSRMANKNVALILSGANIERARFVEVLAGKTPLLI